MEPLEVWPWQPKVSCSCPSGKQQPPQRIPALVHQNTWKQSVLNSPIGTSTLAQTIRSYHTRHDVPQPKNTRRKPHPQHISTIYRPNFRLQDKTVIASACAACSADSEHERYGEPSAHDCGSGGGYARSWRIRWWHVSHDPVAERRAHWYIRVRLTSFKYRFMAASKVLGEETVNGATGAAADASHSKRS